MKQTLFIVVDALASRVVLPALERGELPHLAELVKHGKLLPESVAIFPSITPAATASLVTGRYPREHGVAGAYWYDRREDEVAYYGDDFWVVLKKGFGQFFDDFLVRLNRDRLRSDTIFEIIERGGLKAACLNYLWFRGESEHAVRTPLLLRLIPGVGSRKAVPGPRTLCLGDFVAEQDAPGKGNGADLPSGKGGAFKRFGFADATTAAYLLHLARTRGLEDFTLAYFPDNDFESHSVGPEKAKPVLERFDETLGELFEVYGGCGPMLERLAIVITGDHSQCDMLADDEAARISLEKALSDFSLAEAGQPWGADDELMVCPNMRAAQIYCRPESGVDRRRVVEALLAEERIDQVIWSEGEPGGEQAFHVATGDRGSLTFWRSGRHEESAVDAYGTAWSYEGSLSAVDARVAQRRLHYGDYPNALERIAGSFVDVSGDFWVTARVGCEFAVPETSIHAGGSHGSLHAQDSLSPLIVAGVPDDVRLPHRPRSIDVLPLCLRILGIPSEPELAASASA